jgi:hypothetical protein
MTGLVWDRPAVGPIEVWFDQFSGAELFFVARKRSKEQELEW